MAVYEYKARTKQGKIIKGETEGDSSQDITSSLHSQGLVILSITEKKKKSRQVRAGRVKPDEIVVFTRQLTTLIESGIPLVQGLEILYDQVKTPYFKQVIFAIFNDIKEGTSFNGALSKYPRVFSEFYVNMVKAGETSGQLPGILERVSSYIEDALSLQRKIRSSLAYPAIVVVMAIGITAFLILKVIPTFKGIFSSLGGDLPLPTQILLAFSDFARQWFLAIVVFFILGGIVLQRYAITPRGRRQIDETMLKIPIMGELIKKIAIAKFCRTFSTLVSSGVPILTALDIVGKTAGNKVLEDAVFASRKFVQEGEAISEPLARSGIFPPMVVRMISVGEKTGKLEDMLNKISQFYEDEVDTAVSGLTSMIEPIIIGFLGIVIGGIVVSLFLPIIKITQMIQ